VQHAPVIYKPCRHIREHTLPSLWRVKDCLADAGRLRTIPPVHGRKRSYRKPKHSARHGQTLVAQRARLARKRLEAAGLFGGLRLVWLWRGWLFLGRRCSGALRCMVRAVCDPYKKLHTHRGCDSIEHGAQCSAQSAGLAPDACMRCPGPSRPATRGRHGHRPAPLHSTCASPYFMLGPKLVCSPSMRFELAQVECSRSHAVHATPDGRARLGDDRACSTRLHLTFRQQTTSVTSQHNSHWGATSVPPRAWPFSASCLSSRRLPLPNTTLPAFWPGRVPGAAAAPAPDGTASAGAAQARRASHQWCQVWVGSYMCMSDDAHDGHA